MDCTANKCISHSPSSPSDCQSELQQTRTMTNGSPEYVRRCDRVGNNFSYTLGNSDAEVRKRNVARVLFEQPMTFPAEEKEMANARCKPLCNQEKSTIFYHQHISNTISSSSTFHDSISSKRRQLISDSEVVHMLAEINCVTNSKNSGIRLSSDTKTWDYPTSWASDKGWEADDDSADETVYLPDYNEDDLDLETSWVGYEEDLFQIEVDRKNRSMDTDGFVFDTTTTCELVMMMGQRFKDNFQFRSALQVKAIRDGIKLCIMDNSSSCVSCECSDLDCDWKITAIKELRGNAFVISDINPTHTCTKRYSKLQWGTKWIAAKFLHKWKQNAQLDLTILGTEIAATYGIKCPVWKLQVVDIMAKKWLQIDHGEGYTLLLQYKKEMESVNSRNIVIIETIAENEFSNEIFDRMFVFLYDTAYAFKTRCRMLLTVDGWEIDGPYKSVMLVAVGRDGNDAVLPIAFCEVQEENLDSWAFFLKNLNYGLRLDRGEGLCILGDGDNGIDEAVEEFLPYAVYRQCCFSLYTKMIKAFPDVPIHAPFWAACRSTDEKSFINQMSVIETVNVECYNWLNDGHCHKWALFAMPDWVKSTEITTSATEQLRIWVMKYLHFNVAQRYTTITRKIAETFQRRYMAGWEWVYDKVTPATRQHIIQNVFESEGWIVETASHDTLAIVTRHGVVHDVNLHLMTCSCRLWQLSGIPCQHACRCIATRGEKVDTYVFSLLSVDEYRSTYGPGMNMLAEITQWKCKTRDNVLPPKLRFTHSTRTHESNNRIKAQSALLEFDSPKNLSSSSSDATISL